MKVAISEGWAVVWEGSQVSSGELEVPDDVGRHWCDRGWAHPVVTKPAKAPRR